MFATRPIRDLIRTGAAAGLLCAATALAGPAAAQEAGQTPDDEMGTWIKVCFPGEDGETPEACAVMQEARTDAGEFLLSVSLIESVEGDQKVLRVAVPTGVLLQPGFRVQVDESGEQRPGEYIICLPNACYGEMEANTAIIDEMKRGNNFIVSVINNEGEAVGIGLTLVGFTRGYEGDPIDMEILAQERQRLHDAMQERAEEARQRMLEQQQQQGGQTGQ